ncbi:hypothetical protein HJFPF1_07711 [Paramyrothecium foliicola]|nr:hypothetical protein HJFPF1_07711 [Paramyrothecium foliicola]
MSRLQAPTVYASAGLTELSESQNNVRTCTSIPAPPTKGLKREIPQPGKAVIVVHRSQILTTAQLPSLIPSANR